MRSRGSGPDAVVEMNGKFHILDHVVIRSVSTNVLRGTSRATCINLFWFHLSLYHPNTGDDGHESTEPAITVQTPVSPYPYSHPRSSSQPFHPPYRSPLVRAPPDRDATSRLPFPIDLSPCPRRRRKRGGPRQDRSTPKLSSMMDRYAGTPRPIEVMWTYRDDKGVSLAKMAYAVSLARRYWPQHECRSVLCIGVKHCVPIAAPAFPTAALSP